MSGVYIHIPFCASKCPYCDFYSYRGSEEDRSAYVKAVLDEINTGKRAQEFVNSFKADTLYLGGGTPSVLSGKELYSIITAAIKKYSLPENAEITVECNPASDIESIAHILKSAGVNRVSLGMQSAVDSERKALGRLSGKERIKAVTETLKKSGIDNISLDIMLGIPFQTKKSLNETLKFIKETEPRHVSAYILKVEENTYFGKNTDKLHLPDDDTVCDLYEQCCSYLEDNGYNHYEISNFSKPGFESRHNTKYWLLEDYLGIGSAAHSFVGNKRFYYSRSTSDFINGVSPVFDSIGGDSEEYIMLRLRLKDGLKLSELERLYGSEPLKVITKKAPLLKEQGLVNFDGEKLSLTRKGVLVSNIVIAELI